MVGIGILRGPAGAGRHRNAAGVGLSLLVVISLAACHPKSAAAEAGRAEMTRYACGSCHVIPGVERADGMVGPPLTHFASRLMIAGAVPNNRQNLERFLQSPQSMVKGGVMPDMGVTAGQARTIAAYLGELD